jgi:uncharacterized protein (UPF0264 family)
MRVLISPINLEEAKAVYEGGADIIDIKNVDEGSLGAQFPWIVRDIVRHFEGTGILCSATLGDLPFKPGTAALAAHGVAHCGVGYVKAGLHGVRGEDECFAMMSAIARASREVNPEILVVASGYADYRKFGGLTPRDLVNGAARAECDLVMVDTAIKGPGGALLDNMSLAEVTEFCDMARDKGMRVALAGSVNAEAVARLAAARPDIIGVRGAVCQGTDRRTSIVARNVAAFMEQVRALEASAA